MKPISILNFLIITILGLLLKVTLADEISLNNYTTEVLTVTIVDKQQKIFVVNGSTCRVEVHFFTASSTGRFAGKTVREYYYAIKQFKEEDRNNEGRARYVLEGKDGRIFIEDNFIGYDERNRPVTIPKIITDIAELAWLQTADLRGYLQDKGDGKQVLHIKWNESNTNEIPFPTVKIPDEPTEPYEKDLFTVDLTILGADTVVGVGEVLAMMNGFSCTSTTEEFKGQNVDIFADTRIQYPGQPQSFSAVFLMEGKDDEDCVTNIYIEDSGVVSNNGDYSETFIVTDNPKWAWIEKAPIHSYSIDNGDKIQIRLRTINDSKLWEPEPEPEVPSKETDQKSDQVKDQDLYQNPEDSSVLPAHSFSLFFGIIMMLCISLLYM